MMFVLALLGLLPKKTLRFVVADFRSESSWWIHNRGAGGNYFTYGEFIPFQCDGRGVNYVLR
jgi:hypothetical protein